MLDDIINFESICIYSNRFDDNLCTICILILHTQRVTHPLMNSCGISQKHGMGNIPGVVLPKVSQGQRAIHAILFELGS